MPCVLSHQSAGDFSRRTAFDRIGQSSVLLHQIWLPITLLTLPGGAIAFYAKKQNALGAVALSIGNTVVALLGVSYFQKLCHSFLRHLLTVVSCAAIIAVLLMGMQQKWKTRFLSAATTLLLTAGVIIWAVLNERVI